MESLLKLFSLVGKTAVVTGGTRGIGQAMAIAFAEAGADIILIQVYKGHSSIYKARRPLTDASAT
jgi:NAD(P)-dependent dehydrogenase (short-subunit alcohol dehydrogenase family)